MYWLYYCTRTVDVRGERLRFLVSESPAITNPSSQARAPLRPPIAVQVMPHVSPRPDGLPLWLVRYTVVSCERSMNATSRAFRLRPAEMLVVYMRSQRLACQSRRSFKPTVREHHMELVGPCAFGLDNFLCAAPEDRLLSALLYIIQCL